MVLKRYAGSVCGTEVGVAPTEVVPSTAGIGPKRVRESRAESERAAVGIVGLRNPWSGSSPLRLLAFGAESERL